MVIDDQAIRTKAFSEAEKLIKKLDKLELNLESFHARDQRLFSDWYDLTFRKMRELISSKSSEYRQLCEFHNWIIVTAKMHKIDLPEAILILREEEKRYSSGTAQDRENIENTRRLRNQFLKEEMEREFNELRDEEFDLDDELDGWDHSKRSQNEEDCLNELMALTDKKLSKLCRDRFEAISLLGQILALAQSKVEIQFFLKAWDFTPKKYQVTFSKAFQRETGQSFRVILEEMRRRVAEPTNAEDSNESQRERIDQNRRGSELNEDYLGLQRSVRSKSGAALESVKIVYRKLVRRLHPDLQEGQEGLSHWQQKIWMRTQQAHKTQNQGELEKLLRLVLIRNRELNDITVSEIFEGQMWLEDELQRMNDEVKCLKRLPAWGFSRKKDYSSLKRKLNKSIDAELETLNTEIETLKMQHKFFENLARAEAGFRNRRRSKPSARQKKRRRPNSTTRSRRKSTASQTSLFD